MIFPLIPDSNSNEEISEKMKEIELELVEKLETELNEDQVNNIIIYLLYLQYRFLLTYF